MTVTEPEVRIECLEVHIYGTYGVCSINQDHGAMIMALCYQLFYR